MKLRRFVVGALTASVISITAFSVPAGADGQSSDPTPGPHSALVLLDCAGSVLQGGLLVLDVTLL